MKLKNAVRVALALSGKYDTKQKLIVKGTDAFGNQVTEEINAIDYERLEKDAQEIISQAQ